MYKSRVSSLQHQHIALSIYQNRTRFFIAFVYKGEVKKLPSEILSA